MFLFCITILFYLLGYSSISGYKGTLQQNFETQNENLNPIDTLVTRVFGSIPIAGFIGIISIIGISLIIGYGAIYVLPAIMLLLFLNYFVFPLSYIFDATLDPMLKYVFFGFFNLITVLAVLTFIRGDA